MLFRIAGPIRFLGCDSIITPRPSPSPYHSERNPGWIASYKIRLCRSSAKQHNKLNNMLSHDKPTPRIQMPTLAFGISRIRMLGNTNKTRVGDYLEALSPKLMFMSTVSFAAPLDALGKFSGNMHRDVARVRSG